MQEDSDRSQATKQLALTAKNSQNDLLLTTLFSQHWLQLILNQRNKRTKSVIGFAFVLFAFTPHQTGTKTKVLDAGHFFLHKISYQGKLRQNDNRKESKADPCESLDERESLARIFPNVQTKVYYARKASDNRAQARAVESVQKSPKVR